VDVTEQHADTQGAWLALTDEQLGELMQYGERRRVEAGEVLFDVGDVVEVFIVILAGRVAVAERVGDSERVIAIHGRGHFLGDIGLLTAQAAFFNAVVAEPGEVLTVPVDRLRDVVARDPDLGDLVVRAFLARRSLLIGHGAGLTIVGSCFSPDTRRLRDFAARNRLPHRWIDLEQDAEAEALLRRLHVSPEETPIVIWRAAVLRRPSNAELATAIGLRSTHPSEGVHDLIVVGAGPSGLAASVYGASEGLDTVTLDSVATGGQAGTTMRIENYLGFPAGISGAELADRAVVQARRFGASITVPAEATALEQRGGDHVIRLDDGSEVVARTVIVATGVHYRRLPVERLDEFEGTSIYYAATLAEGRLCTGDPVAVVGGGNSAGRAALFLSDHVASLTLIVRENDLEEHMSRYLADRIRRNPRIELRLGHEVCELVGERGLDEVVIEDRQTGQRTRVEAHYLFVFIGAQPYTAWLGDEVLRDAGGYVLTGQVAGDGRAMLETSRPGVFAVGDMRSGSIKRVASAVGDGSMAVRMVHEHLADRERSEGLAQPEPVQTKVSST
jgi:thioredoxin reductase (NADPH)